MRWWLTLLFSLSVLLLFGQRQKEVKFFKLSDESFERGAIFRTYNLHFYKAEIQENSFATLDSVAAFLIQHPELFINIGVHIPKGYIKDYEVNPKKIDQERAAAIRDYLVFKGVNHQRLVPEGFGWYEPLIREKELLEIDEKERGEMRMKNLRVEFKIIGIIEKKEE